MEKAISLKVDRSLKRLSTFLKYLLPFNKYLLRFTCNAGQQGWIDGQEGNSCSQQTCHLVQFKGSHKCQNNTRFHAGKVYGMKRKGTDLDRDTSSSSGSNDGAGI